MSIYEQQKDGYTISTDALRLNVSFIHDYLSNASYWAKDIPIEIVRKSIDNSLPFGLYHDGKQIGFARLVTDKCIFAYLADVFIVESYRGKGLSKWLIETIQAHPELQRLRRWILATRDAHGLYEQFGWTVFDEDNRKRFMQRHFKDVYQPKKD